MLGQSVAVETQTRAQMTVLKRLAITAQNSASQYIQPREMSHTFRADPRGSIRSTQLDDRSSIVIANVGVADDVTQCAMASDSRVNVVCCELGCDIVGDAVGGDRAREGDEVPEHEVVDHAGFASDHGGYASVGEALGVGFSLVT